MASRKYTVGRPTQEVRLKDWPAGQVAQFKRAIEMLETELNTTVASQIEQGAKRVVSARVPRVTGLTVTSGFKNFQINFNEAKGINDLLFYEIQKDNFANFKNPTTYTTPQTTLTIPTAEEREVIYIRVRVMNSKFQVGPWSAAVSVTGSGNFRINTIRGERTTLEIAPEDFNTWIDIQTISINVGQSALSASVQPGLVTLMSVDYGEAPPEKRFITYHNAKFRMLRNGVELTTAGQWICSNSSTYDNKAGEGLTSTQKEEEASFGVIITPFESFVNKTVTYTIQAYIIDEASVAETWTSDEIASSGVTLIDNPLIVIDNFDILEIIQIT